MWIKIEEWLTPMEYSRYIGKSMSWVTKLMQEKKIDYIKYSGGRLIHKSGKIKDCISNKEMEEREQEDKLFEELPNIL